MVAITIVGSVALDSVKTPFGTVENALGGAATYASVAASFFATPGVVAVVGTDFPAEHLQLLEEKGVDTKGIKKEGKTFRWSGFYEYDMNEAKTIKTELNSFEHFAPELPDSYRNAKFVFLANIHPALQLKVLEQVHAPMLVMLDTMNLWIQNTREELLKVIRKVDVFLINDGEARMLFDTPNLVKAAAEALKLGPKHVIIKKGEHGALYFTQSTHFSAPSFPLEVIRDPTGCGDTFAGGIIGYLAKTNDISEQNIRKAIIYGSALASFNAEDFSLNRLKSMTMQDLEARYKEFEFIRNF